jgi:hypothetical protein
VSLLGAAVPDWVRVRRTGGGDLMSLPQNVARTAALEYCDRQLDPS